MQKLNYFYSCCQKIEAIHSLNNRHPIIMSATRNRFAVFNESTTMSNKFKNSKKPVTMKKEDFPPLSKVPIAVKPLWAKDSTFAEKAREWQRDDELKTPPPPSYTVSIISTPVFNNTGVYEEVDRSDYAFDNHNDYYYNSHDIDDAGGGKLANNDEFYNDDDSVGW